MAPAARRPRPLAPTVRKSIVRIMPAAHPPSPHPCPDDLPVPPAGSAPPRKKRRADRARTSRSTSPARSASASPPASASPLPRRRAPPLERLPRWLFAPRRHFIAAHGELPLPRRVAVRGKPFYDWDAWALALLAPDLWRRRGPWQRLIASCAAAKPPHVDVENVPDIKAALVRIVVAEVVSQLVSRNGDNLTPEDRNWITSVASRQRGRHVRKPTLMLLFDLAFAVFDLAAFCRRNKLPAVSVTLGDSNGKGKNDVVDVVEESIRHILTDSCVRGKTCTTSEAADRPELAAKSRAPETEAVSVDPVVWRVLQAVGKRDNDASDTWIIDNVNKAIDVIEKFLAMTKAARWHRRFPSKVAAAKNGLMQAAEVFAHRLPLTGTESGEDPKAANLFPGWLRASLEHPNWALWAEFANDCNYVISMGAIPEEKARDLACEYAVKALITNSDFSTVDSTVNQIVSTQQQYRDQELTMRRIFDISLGLEQFYSFFVESYGNEATVGKSVQWGVMSHESLVYLLAGLREVLLHGSLREQAMVDWSATSVDISNYYREAIIVNDQMGEDIERAVQSAFAEASWDSQQRMARLMISSPSAALSPSGDKEGPGMPQLWLLNLDPKDEIHLATAIVPWDPQRALMLLDRAIGLDSTMMEAIRNGEEHLPLWDFRRVAIFRVLMYRGSSFQYIKLIMERLQILFDRRVLHEGGTFSAQSVPLLEAAVKEGNYCAQATLGLLLAGQGQFWDVARSWARCEKSVVDGIQHLYLSACAGDLEAATALSHIWAQCEDGDGEEFRGVNTEQIVSLFRGALQTQNAKAIMNIGVMWRYGVCCLQANAVIAVESFLMALQGGIYGEARFVAAKHLSEMIETADGQGILKILALLSKSQPRKRSTTSPYRIDDFCGLTQ